MENVLDEIRAELGDLAGYSVIYRDSLGIWDGVRVTDRGGVDFYSLRETERDKATGRLLHLIH